MADSEAAPALCLQCAHCLDDFDIENGATHIVPYSHKWHDRRVDQDVETLQLTMRSGTMLMWAGSLWHGGGANTSAAGEFKHFGGIEGDDVVDIFRHHQCIVWCSGLNRSRQTRRKDEPDEQG